MGYKKKHKFIRPGSCISEFQLKVNFELLGQQLVADHPNFLAQFTCMYYMIRPLDSCLKSLLLAQDLVFSTVVLMRFYYQKRQILGS